MWSLGVMLYILLSGRHPFDAPGRTDAAMRAAIQRGLDAASFEDEPWGAVSPQAKHLIAACNHHLVTTTLSPPSVTTPPGEPASQASDRRAAKGGPAAEARPERAARPSLDRRH